jgi:FtsH-binding integral membrane protein
MHEYDAIRSEIDQCLMNQVSILSFGAATVGLLVTAAAALWASSLVLAGSMLLFVVPMACFLALVIHAGEQVRMMRAGLFLHALEVWVNDILGPPEGLLLAWEHWAIRSGANDVDQHNRRAIAMVFGLLALGSIFVGFWRLESAPKGHVTLALAVVLLVVSMLLAAIAAAWVFYLSKFAYVHRDEYRN